MVFFIFIQNYREHSVSKQWRPCSGAAFCGIWIGFELFAYVPQKRTLGLYGLTHNMLGYFSCFCWRLLTFFQNQLFQRVSNGLDPDQYQHSVSPDLGPNYLQKLSADNTKVTSTRERIKRCNINDTVCIMDVRTDKPKVECLNFFKVEGIKKVVTHWDVSYNQRQSLGNASADTHKKWREKAHEVK